MSAFNFHLTLHSNETATTKIYTLSLHDALPIFRVENAPEDRRAVVARQAEPVDRAVLRHERGGIAVGQERVVRDRLRDRKSTRLNSSHMSISYAVFCLKKKTSSILLTWIQAQLN